MNIQQIQNFRADAEILRRQADAATQKYFDYLKDVAMRYFYHDEKYFESAFEYEVAELSRECINVGKHVIIEYMVFEKIDDLLKTPHSPHAIK